MGARTPQRFPGPAYEENKVNLADRGGDPSPLETGDIWRAGSDLFANDGAGKFNLRSGSGITAPEHRVLLQLIHFLDEGPAKGFTSGAYKVVTGGIFPTKVEWFRQDDKLLIEKTIERSAGGATNLKPTPIVWKLYDTDGTTVLETVSDAVTYSGINEVGRVRTIS